MTSMVSEDAVWIDVLPAMNKFAPALAAGVDTATASMSQKFASAGKKMEARGKSMSRNLTLPIAGAGLAVLKMSGDFEKSMNKVGALTGSTGKELEGLRNQAKELGATTQFSASQAADAMSFLGMAGFETNEIMAAMPGTLDLAASSGMDLATTADIMSNVLTGFGKKAEEAGHLSDVMAKAVSSSNTDMLQLGDAMKYVAPVAASAGVSLEEATAAIGLMGNAGIQGSMAGTALRGSISRLLDPTKKAAKTLKALGVNALDSEGNLKPMHNIVQQLGDSGAKTADFMAIFGQRAGPAMAALVDQGAGALKGLTGDLEESGGTAKRMADQQMQGLNGEMMKLKSAAEGLAISIGESGLLSMVTGMVTGFTGWISSLSKTNPEVLKLVTGLALALAAIGPILFIGGKLIGTVISLVGAFGKAITIIKVVVFNFRILTMVLMANPIGIVITALVALGVALVVAYKKSDTFRAVVQSAWEKIKSAIKFAWEQVIQPVLKAFWSFIKDVLVPTIKGLYEKVVKPIFKVIAFNIEVAWNIIKLIFDAWVLYFKMVLAPIFRFLWNEVIKPVFNSIKDKIVEVWRDHIKPVFKALGDFINEKVAPAFRTGVDAIGSAWDTIKEKAKVPVNFVIDTVYNNGIRAAFNKVAEFLKSDARLPHVSPIGGSGQSRRPRSGGVQEFGGGGSGLLPAMGGIGSTIKGWAGKGWEFVRDKAFGGITGLLSRVGDSPFGQIVGGIGKKLLSMAMSSLSGKFADATDAGLIGGKTGKAGRVLPAGSYRIGMPYLGYPGHYGADYPAGTGTPVFSPWPGRVIASYDIPGSNPYNNTPYASYGRVVKVAHDNGMSTLYAHLNSRIGSLGPIRAGQQIGTVGTTGKSTGSHLHFEARRGSSTINPAGLGLFDSGGWLQHGQAALNLSGKPEPVFTGGQWDTLEKMASSGGVGNTEVLERLESIERTISGLPRQAQAMRRKG